MTFKILQFTFLSLLFIIIPGSLLPILNKEFVLNHQSLISIQKHQQSDEVLIEAQDDSFIMKQNGPDDSSKNLNPIAIGMGNLVINADNFLIDETTFDGNPFGLKEPTFQNDYIQKYRDSLRESKIQKTNTKLNKQDKLKLKNALALSQNQKFRRVGDSTNITSQDGYYTQTPHNYMIMNTNSLIQTQTQGDRQNQILKGLKEKYLYNKGGLIGKHPIKNLKNSLGIKEPSKYQHTLKSIGEGSQASSLHHQSLFHLRNKTEDNYNADTQLRQNQETAILKRTRTVRYYESTIQEDKIQFQRSIARPAEKSLEDVRPQLLNNDSGNNIINFNQTMALKPIQLDDESRNSTNNAKVYSIDAQSNYLMNINNNNQNAYSPYLDQSLENVNRFKNNRDFDSVMSIHK